MNGAGADSAEPELSVILVTWNCEKLLADCLRSIREHAGNIAYEVIVVDNASGDGTLAMLERDFPAVRIQANDENTGFSRANNQGMAMAKAPLFCLLNPDTLLTEADTLLRMRQRMAAHPEIGAAGCRLTFPDGTHQVGDAGGLPDIRSVMAHALLLSRLAPRRFRGLFLQEGSIAPPFGKVAWVCGACTIVRRDVFRKIGGLDESYFLYGEDVEWGCRMTAAGILVAYFPDISIVHLQGGTQKGKGLSSTRWIDGLARLFINHNQRRNWWLFRASLAFGFLMRAMIYTVTPGTSRGAEMLSYARYVWGLRRPATTDSTPV
jgi:GT2 family glycosyltransferase